MREQAEPSHSHEAPGRQPTCCGNRSRRRTETLLVIPHEAQVLGSLGHHAPSCQWPLRPTPCQKACKSQARTKCHLCPAAASRRIRTGSTPRPRRAAKVTTGEIVGSTHDRAQPCNYTALRAKQAGCRSAASCPPPKCPPTPPPSARRHSGFGCSVHERKVRALPALQACCRC